MASSRSPRDLNLAQRKARYTVGIDFGNSFSGYAFAANSDPDVVTVNWKWEGQEQSGFPPYCKTRTASVVRPGASDVDRWGWPAVLDTTARFPSASPADAAGEDDLVSSLSEPLSPLLLSRSGSTTAAAAETALVPSTPPRPSSSSDRELLINFKMLLAPRGSGGGASSSSSPPPSATAAAPAQLPSGWTPRALVARFLRRLGSEAMAALRAKYPLARDDDVQFCLTVPAIWDEDAKQTMRLAAEDAGLGGGGARGAGLPLLMVLEPEAAAVYVHKTLSRTVLDLRPGDVTMLVDCGGGTVDIVSHVREDHGGPFPRLREVVKGSGACCGASALDARFLRAAARRIPVFDEFRRRHPAEAVALLLGPWERAKRGYGGDGPATVRLPPALVQLWSRHRAEFYADAGAEDDEDELLEELTLSEAEMHDIFRPVLERIAELIEAQLAASASAGACRAIVAVGGFAQQPFLQRALTVEFLEDGGIPVVFPENPGVAVVEGAVIYGLHPEAIQVRCARKTYGVECSRWLRRCDEENSRLTKFFNEEEERWHVGGVFHRFVASGEVVAIDRAVSHSYGPVFRDQAALCFNVFSTSDPNPETVHDEGCAAEARMTVEFPRDAKYEEKDVELRMFFGRTTIEVVAVDKWGREQKCSIAFAKQYQ